MKKLLLIGVLFLLAPVSASASVGAGASTMPFQNSICSGSKWETVQLSSSHSVVCTSKVNIPAGKAKTLRVQCSGATPRTGYGSGTYLPTPAQEWMLFASHRAVRWDGDIFGKVDGIVTRVKVRNWSPSRQQVMLAAGCHADNTLPRFDWGVRKTRKFNLIDPRNQDPEIIPWVASRPGPGNDLLVATPGQVSATRAGNDTVIGSHRADRIYGGLGNDELRGWLGNDRIYGGPGHDVIMGQAGNDILYGGPGNDVIIDTQGVDRIFGGPGRDFINVKDGNRDFVNCGRGFDTVIADRKDRLVGCERILYR